MKNDTTSASISDDYILHLFHLQKEQIDSFQVNHQDDGVHVRIKLTPKTTSCPVCGFPTSKVKSYVHKRITHSMLNTEACYIDYQARRYICPACNKTFYEDNPFTFKGMKISLLTVYNVLRDLKNPADTFKSVGTMSRIRTHLIDTFFIFKTSFVIVRRFIVTMTVNPNCIVKCFDIFKYHLVCHLIINDLFSIQPLSFN